MPEPPLDPELTALGAALGRLAPAAPALDRDRLLYEAGRRSARPRSRGWPLAACAFAALAAGLGWRLAAAPDVPAPVERIVYVTAPAERPPERSPGTSAPDTPAPEPARSEVLVLEPSPARAPYVRLRDQVVRFGAESLPGAAPVQAPAADLPLERLLGLPFGSLSDEQKARWKTQLSRGDV